MVIRSDHLRSRAGARRSTGAWVRNTGTMGAHMPTYAYRCDRCDIEFDVVQSFSDKTLTEHDACGGPVRKLFTPTGVVFKGSGFYITDSRKPEKAGSSASGSPKSESGGSTSAAAKNEGSSAG